MSKPTNKVRLSCNTCLVTFQEIAAQRQHFKEDFHRFNLKRKAASLGPVTEEVFDNLLLQIEQENQVQPEDTWVCNVCSKKYSSFMSMQQHLNSNRHKELALESDVGEEYSPLVVEQSDAESMDDEQFDELVENFINDPKTLLDCLFCNESSENLDLNMDHMKNAHSFSIPLNEYIADVEGLICYLATKVRIAYMCVSCAYSGDTGRVFSSVRGCQTHMLHKGHISFDPIEDEIEYSPFYDLDRYYDQISNLDKLKNADIEFELPNGRVAVNRKYALYYKKNETSSREIISIERTEEEKQIIAHEKLVQIQTKQTKKQESKAKRYQLKHQVFNNQLLRSRYRLRGAENMHH